MAALVVFFVVVFLLLRRQQWLQRSSGHCATFLSLKRILSPAVIDWSARLLTWPGPTIRHCEKIDREHAHGGVLILPLAKLSQSRTALILTRMVPSDAFRQVLLKKKLTRPLVLLSAWNTSIIRFFRFRLSPSLTRLCLVSCWQRVQFFSRF